MRTCCRACSSAIFLRLRFTRSPSSPPPLSPSLSPPSCAPSRRRANDLIREQWLSINNPVSPFTLPGHPAVRCLSADCRPSPPPPPPTTKRSLRRRLRKSRWPRGRNSARKSCLSVSLPPPPRGISPRG